MSGSTAVSMTEPKRGDVNFGPNNAQNKGANRETRSPKSSLKLDEGGREIVHQRLPSKDTCSERKM